MAAIWKGHKQYFIECETDRKICGKYKYNIGNANTIKTAKSMISRYRKEYAQYNPRNFKVYDCYADVDESTNFVPCVYSEE